MYSKNLYNKKSVNSQCAAKKQFHLENDFDNRNLIRLIYFDSDNHSLSPESKSMSEIPPPDVDTKLNTFSSHFRRKTMVGPNPFAPVYSSPWRTNFIIVFTPLLLWGFPIHLLFLHPGKIYSGGTKQWLKSSFTCPHVILTVLTALVCLVFNIALFYALGRLVQTLIINGKVTLEFFDLVTTLFSILPIAVPLNLFWLKGYQLRNFIIFTSNETNLIKAKKQVDAEGAEFDRISNKRTTLILIYVSILLIHVLDQVSNFYTNDISKQANFAIQDQIWIVAMNYFIPVLSTFVLPIYACFCFLIRYQIDLAQEYVEALIKMNVGPTYDHFDEIKKMAKDILDSVMMTNSTFSIILSVVVIMVGFELWGEVGHLVLTLFNIALTAFLGLREEGVDPAVVKLFDIVANVTGNRSTAGLEPATIRLVVADCVIIFGYVALFGWTVWQAVRTNDAIRAIHVWLNDFVTGKEARLSLEVHDAVYIN
ncbi:hypothetical protein Fcan01_01600 [Folsomia candida]|uniref:Uncharacterized protein n=1 Tax=Folsomia candida TaxID=158441 RepID=A0A226F221_FOLCA|nr:hypothetical protein Fcan01_01600 [Folsomia candida]